MASVNTRSLTIEIDSVEYAAQVFSATVEAAADDDVTYAEAAAGGGRLYNLVLTLTQDMAASSLWRQIWDAAGDDVAVVMRPYGNDTASVSQPHYTMTANVREPDGAIIGGDANNSTTARQKVTVTWPLTGRPVEDDGS